MAKLFRREYQNKQTGERKQLRKYYAKVRHADGVVRKVPFSANKAASEIALGKLLERIEKDKRSPSGRKARGPRP